MDSRLISLLPKFAALPLAFLISSAAAPALADTYTLPDDLRRAPFNCSGAGQYYNCGSIDLDKDALLVLTGPVTLQISGNFSTDKNLSTRNNGYAFDVSVGGSVDLKKDLDVTMNLTVGGSIDIAKDARFTGNITAGGNVHFAKDSIYDGDVTVGGFLDVDKNTYITGTCRAGATNYYDCGKKPPLTGLHHVRIDHDGSALTCTPAPLTVYACAGSDSKGMCAAYTGGVKGTVRTDTGLSVPFNIPQNSSSAVIALGVPTATTVTLSADGFTATNGYTCWDGGSDSCKLSFEDAAFVLTVPDHLAGTQQTLKIEAVKKDNVTSKCTPGFSGTRNIALNCRYSNPATSTSALKIGGNDLVCNTGAKTFALDFDTEGVARPSLSYADVGALNIRASLASPAMMGADSFVVAPASFSVVPVAPPDHSIALENPLRAGLPFVAQVVARNASGKVTPNFGKESPRAQVRIGFKKCKPAGGADGIFTGSFIETFSNGAAISGEMSWTESGTGGFRAYLDNNPASTSAPLAYLSSTIRPDSSTGCNTVFVPDHFDIQYTEARLFWYSGQPIEKVKVIARAYTAPDAAPSTTRNYMLEAPASAQVDLSALANSQDSEQIKAEIGALKLEPDTGKTVIPGSAFQSPDQGAKPGEADITPIFTFKKIKTPPQKLVLRATDASTKPLNGTEPITSSKNGLEPATIIRSGRLRMFNAFGGTNTKVQMLVRAEYWNGLHWLFNADDKYTRILRQSMALSPKNLAVAVENDLALNGGQGTLILSKTAGSTGYVDVALNLAKSQKTPLKDQSCLATHPDTMGGNAPWLRSWYGACSVSDPPDNDPSARANFGVTTPENRATIFVREVFN